MTDSARFFEIPSLEQFLFRVSPDGGVRIICDLCGKYTKDVYSLSEAIGEYNFHVCRERA